MSDLKTNASSRGRRLTTMAAKGVKSMSGAMVAPLTQALPSLLLQVVVLRAIGAEDFADYSLIYGGLILLTAVTSGLIGDSLIVLDRHDPRIRAGGMLLACASISLSAAGAAAVVWMTGLLPGSLALLFGASVAIFQIEDLARRMLMAVMRFWRIVVVDLVVLTATVAWLLAVTAFGTFGMVHAIAAIGIAQAGGLAVALALLPAEERRRLSPFGGQMSKVFAFGVWRALQKGLKPLFLTLFRLVVIVAATKEAFAGLEAARVYTGPIMLVVQGVAGYTLSSYARQKGSSPQRLLRNADGVSAMLVGMVTAVGALVVAVTPLASPVITGGELDLDRLAVAGWVLFAGTTAIGMSYMSLATSVGRQVGVFMCKAAEAALSLVVVTLVVGGLGVAASWAPWCLLVTSLGSAFVLRLLAVAGLQAQPTASVNHRERAPK